MVGGTRDGSYAQLSVLSNWAYTNYLVSSGSFVQVFLILFLNNNLLLDSLGLASILGLLAESS